MSGTRDTVARRAKEEAMPDSPREILDVTTAHWRGRALQGASFCALVPGAVDTGGTTAHFLPVAVMLAAFVGAGVWMFRRWGGKQPAQAPERLPAAEPGPALLRPHADA
jgi:hypothetical protein